MPSWPSRNALLLFGSSHESVPGANVLYSSFPYSSALTVSGLLMTTSFFSLTSLPPCDHTSQCVHVLPSPVALPSAKPPGVPLSLSAFIMRRKPSVSLGTASYPAAFSMLVRYTSALPAQPSGTPIHFLPSGRRYWWHTGYQPPYFLPRYSATSVTSTSLSG